MDILIRREVIDETVGLTPSERVELLHEWSEDAAKVIADLRAETTTLMAEAAVMEAAANALAEAVAPYVSPVQNADYSRQLREYDALVAALAAYRALTTSQEVKP